MTHRYSTICALIFLCFCHAHAQDYIWQKITVPDPSVIECSAISSRNQIYIGTNDGEYLHRTDDFGANWIHCPIYSLSSPTETPTVYDVEVNPSGIVYVTQLSGHDGGENYCGMMRSLDAGITWERMTFNYYCDEHTMTMAPNGDVYFGTYDGAAALYPDGYHWYGPWLDFGNSRPYGNSKHEFVVGYPGNFYAYLDGSWKIIPLIITTYNINNLSYIFYSESGDVYRSVDKGDTFEKVYDSSTPIHEIEIDANNYIYLATADGVVKSDNHGNTWDTIGLNGKEVMKIDYNSSGNLLAHVRNGSETQIYYGENTVLKGLLGVLLPAFDGYEIPMLQEFRIRWTHLGNVGNEIKIELYEDHEFKNTITDNTYNDGAYDWMVTRQVVENANYQFKVISIADPSINAWSPTFKIVKAPGTRLPKSYTARCVPESHIPDIDGQIDEAIWDEAEAAQTLDFGGTPGVFNTAWTATADASVTWRALWCQETNKLYVAVEVRDDIRGAFDNGVGSAVYSPAHDESIEIMTDGNANGGNFLEMFEPAQYWRITAYNHLNLLNCPSTGDHPYTGDAIVSAVQLGPDGNWTCELQMTVYDAYPSDVRTLATGDKIGWEMWYNDSDNQSDKGSYYAIDQQIGWMYWGQSWKYSDFSGDLILGQYVQDLTPTKELTIYTYPCSAGFTADGAAHTQMGNFDWLLYSTHTVHADSEKIIDENFKYIFESWSDGGERLHDFTVTEAVDELVANYRAEYFLDVASDHGTATGEGWHRENTVALFSVDAEVTEDNIRYRFNHWEGDYSGSTPSGQIVIDGPPVVTAVWDRVYRLDVSVQDETGGDVDPDEAVWADEGSTVAVTATPETGYVFSRWTGDVESTDNPLSVVMDGPKAIEAVFETASAVKNEALPTAFALYQNMPNPFNPETSIGYDIPNSGEVRIEIFDLMGRHIRTLVNAMQQPGSYRAVWNGRDEGGRTVASGTYIYMIRCGDYHKRMKAVFLK